MARAPYSATIFVDTDTFVCDAAPLLALGHRLMKSYDVMLLLPRTTQGWVNSGVLGVRRESARGWATAWQREFTSLHDFGDQLHLLKVLPVRSEDVAARADGGGGRVEYERAVGRGVEGRGGGRGGGRTGGRARGALRVGELSPELHIRVGSVPEQSAMRLPALRGPAMLLHSKGLASLAPYAPFLAERFSGRAPTSPAQRQLIRMLGDGQVESRRKGDHALYSPKLLAGFCAMLNEGWGEAGTPPRTRQLILSSNGTCDGCARLAAAPGAVGVVLNAPVGSAVAAAAAPYECTEARGDCGVQPALWPSGSERALPEWYTAWLRGAPGSDRPLHLQ